MLSWFNFAEWEFWNSSFQQQAARSSHSYSSFHTQQYQYHLSSSHLCHCSIKNYAQNYSHSSHSCNEEVSHCLCSYCRSPHLYVASCRIHSSKSHRRSAWEPLSYFLTSWDLVNQRLVLQGLEDHFNWASSPRSLSSILRPHPSTRMFDWWPLISLGCFLSFSALHLHREKWCLGPRTARWSCGLSCCWAYWDQWPRP